MTDETCTLTRFAMGAAVPEWLLSVEPNGPDANRGNPRFAQDVILIETPDRYMLHPQHEGVSRPMIDFGDMHDCNVLAASKITICPMVWITWYRRGDGVPMVPTGAGEQWMPQQFVRDAQEHVRQEFGQRPPPLVKAIQGRPWWRRLLDGLGG